MAKDVASVESPVAITVKRGASSKDVKTQTAEGKKITIETDTKLTAGDYTVTIKGLETDVLEKTVTVAQNETLTKFEIGKELIANSTTDTTNGYIYYSARNQYGERMNANAPQPSVSFSNSCRISKPATATADGKIEVTNINTALAILGAKGTVVLVDNTTGVNNTAEVTYASAATAAEVEIVGSYDTIHSKFADMVAEDNQGNYYLLMTFKDQYGYTMSKDNTLIADVLKDGITVAGGVTKLEKSAPNENATKEVVIDGKEYIALTFKSGVSLLAGEATMTIVNNKRGLLKTQTIKIMPFVAIASFVANADNGLYDKQDNELNFEATDTNGNAVTDYATLNKLVKKTGSNDLNWRFVRQKDGSAKMFAKPNQGVASTTDSTDTATKTISQSYALNDAVSGNFKVQTQLYTLCEERFIKKAHSLAAGTSTQVANGRTLKIGYDKFVYEDQYSTKIADGDHNYTKSVTDAAVTAAAISQASVYVVSDAGMTVTITSDAIEFTPNSPSAFATVYVKYHTSLTSSETNWIAAADNYDFKFTVNSVDTAEAAASTLKLVNIKDGNQENVSLGSASAIDASWINVEVLQGGVWTRIPDSQIVIDSKKNDKINSGDKDDKDKQIETQDATVNFTVTTFDSDNNPTYTPMSGTWKISTKAAELYKVDKDSTTNVISTGAIGSKIVTASSLYNLFTYKDQYGSDITISNASSASALKYSAVVQGSDKVRVYSENSNNIKIDGTDAAGSIDVEITVVAPNGSTKKRTISIQF